MLFPRDLLGCFDIANGQFAPISGFFFGKASCYRRCQPLYKRDAIDAHRLLIIRYLTKATHLQQSEMPLIPLGVIHSTR